LPDIKLLGDVPLGPRTFHQNKVGLFAEFRIGRLTPCHLISVEEFRQMQMLEIVRLIDTGQRCEISILRWKMN
jgi:hypothetical protein